MTTKSFLYYLTAFCLMLNIPIHMVNASLEGTTPSMVTSEELPATITVSKATIMSVLKDEELKQKEYYSAKLSINLGTNYKVRIILSPKKSIVGEKGPPPSVDSQPASPEIEPYPYFSRRF